MDLQEDLDRVNTELKQAQAELARLEARIEGLIAHRDGLVRRLETARRATAAKDSLPNSSLADMYKRPAILEVLRRADRPLSASEITERLRAGGRANEQVNTVQLYLTALFQDEKVIRPKRGRYELAPDSRTSEA